jgi:hypothetical protein
MMIAKNPIIIITIKCELWEIKSEK